MRAGRRASHGWRGSQQPCFTLATHTAKLPCHSKPTCSGCSASRADVKLQMREEYSSSSPWCQSLRAAWGVAYGWGGVVRAGGGKAARDDGMARVLFEQRFVWYVLFASQRERPVFQVERAIKGLVEGHVPSWNILCRGFRFLCRVVKTSSSCRRTRGSNLEQRRPHPPTFQEPWRKPAAGARTNG